jgi:hypothetical protein
MAARLLSHFYYNGKHRTCPVSTIIMLLFSMAYHSLFGFVVKAVVKRPRDKHRPPICMLRSN